MNFGSHLSIQKGYTQALLDTKELGLKSLQIFSSNPRGRNTKKISLEELALTKKTAIETKLAGHFYLHMPYYVNLASSDKKIWHFSVQTIIKDLNLAEKIGANAVVVHLGNHKEVGVEKGLKQIEKALKQILTESSAETSLLLENAVGAGTEIGFNFEQIGRLISNLQEFSKVGVCLDVCHAFAAGYDFRTPEGTEKVLQEFDQKIGLNFLKLIHLSDPKGELGSKLDRHNSLGKGNLGLKGIESVINALQLKDLDIVLEVPHSSSKELEAELKILTKLTHEV